MTFDCRDKRAFTITSLAALDICIYKYTRMDFSGDLFSLGVFSIFTQINYWFFWNLRTLEHWDFWKAHLKQKEERFLVFLLIKKIITAVYEIV